MPTITERYEAVVTNNEDDEQRGRVKVHCAGLIPWPDGEDPVELPMWVEPIHDWGWFYVPDVGEVIEIEVIVANDSEESFGQASLENLNPRWRGKRFISESEIEDEDKDGVPRVVHSEFKTNYAKRRGFSTPWGHVIWIDDTEDSPQITLKWVMEQLEIDAEIEPEKATEVTIEPDGSLLINFLNKHRLHLTTEVGKLRIALDGEPDAEKHFIEFDAEVPSFKVSLAEEDTVATLDQSVPSVEVSMAGGDHILRLDGSVPVFETVHGGGAGMGVSDKDGDATTVLGDGGVSAVIAEELEAWLNDTYTPAIADMHDNHHHPLNQFIAPAIPAAAAPCLPGGPPSPPSETPIAPASLEDYDAAITSTKLTFPAN
jgi:hypothetical protein